MNILLISFFFPPYNTIGAVRAGKMAKYLQRMGHAVSVIAADNQELSASLVTEIPKDCIYYTRYISLKEKIKWLQRTLKTVNSNKIISYDNKKDSSWTYKFLKRLYRSSFHLPDAQIGWYLFAVFKGCQVAQQEKPDIIYASAMPYTSLLVAKTISQRTGVPWVGELRDLWTDNHYRECGYIRNMIDKKIERNVLSSASGLVTVSKPLSEILKLKYNQPCAVVYNGFDSEDYDMHVRPSMARSIVISYTGTLYNGKRDPSNLFKAIRSLKERRSEVSVDFYGPDVHSIRSLARKYDCNENIKTHNSVSYAESLKIQQTSDLLLFLTWDNPLEKGVLTGKLFEYIGAGRPILGMGAVDNEAARIINSRKIGLFSNDPHAIARYLEKMIACKQSGHAIPSPSPEARQGFSRKEQAAELAKFLEIVIRESKVSK